MLMGVVVLIAAHELKGDKLLMLGMFLLMTIGSLMQAVLSVYYYHNDNYKSLNTDYVLSFVLIIVVAVVYPLVHQWLSSDVAIALMAAATVGIYVFLMLFGGGAAYGYVKAIYKGMPLVDLAKILFIFVIAGLLSKRESMTRSFLAVGYMVVNAAFLAVLSEFGALIIMGSVFIIFLFVFPNKLWVLGGLMLAATLAIGIFCMFGSGLYNRALVESSPSAFAEFFQKIQNQDKSDGSKISDIETLQNLVENSGYDWTGYDVAEIREQLADGEWPSAGTDEEKEAVEKLCENSAFHEAFAQKFCKDKFYGDSVTYSDWIMQLYNDADQGLMHSLNRNLLWMYDKLMARGFLQFMPEKIRQTFFGISSVEKQDQVKSALSAMRIGGLTGAGSHEFIYIPMLNSDMVFSETVSFFGFAMGLFIILLFMIIFRRGIMIQKAIENAPFHQGVSLGLSLMLFIQALVIIAGNLGIFPLTGVTLPFISDGTVSMLVCVMMVTILFTISYTQLNEETEILDAWLKWLPKGIKSLLKEKLKSVQEAKAAYKLDDAFKEESEDEEETEAEVETDEEDEYEEYDKDLYDEDLYDDDDDIMDADISGTEDKNKNNHNHKIRNTNNNKDLGTGQTFIDDWGDDDGL
jgi:cell division protein FtsW (lipid II flippase)